MVHPLAVQLLVDVAAAAEQLGREDLVVGLGLLQAQDVGLLLGDQALDQRARARTELMFHEAIFSRLLTAAAYPVRPHKKKAPAPGAWSEGRLAFVTQGIPRCPGNRGKPQADAESKSI